LVGCEQYLPVVPPYENLKAWQECHRLVLETYRATKSFPKEELYGLTSQARRAAFSAAVNLVEGSAKRGAREYRRFLDIAIGSLAELGYTFRVARELEMLSSSDWGTLDDLRKRAGFLTWRCIDHWATEGGEAFASTALYRLLPSSPVFSRLLPS